MNPIDLEQITQRLERAAKRMEAAKLQEYLRYATNAPKRLLLHFLDGVARGVGFSVGFSFLGALLLYLLRNAALANLPVIGRFLAELVRIVENNL